MQQHKVAADVNMQWCVCQGLVICLTRSLENQLLKADNVPRCGQRVQIDTVPWADTMKKSNNA